MAALETSDRMLETSCGSPHYASPEVVSGKNYHGGPSDIWSCGIILFALLTGHLPFDDDNIRRLLLKVQAGKFSMPPDLSPEAQDLISRMLCVDPEKRITMPEILAHPFLHKYPPSKRSMSYYKAPPPIPVSHPVNSVEEIDSEILKNLQTLWHGADKETIINQLLSPEQNSEKTFYCLLMKYRHDHIDDYKNDNYSTNEKTKPTLSSSMSKQKLRHSHSNSHIKRHSHHNHHHYSNHTRHSSRNSSRHSRSGSKSSIITASSSHKRGVSFSSVKQKTRSNNSIKMLHSRQSSPPPPLPLDALKLLAEQEMKLNNQKPKNVNWTTDVKRNSAEFASMLEQAFNFDISSTINSNRAVSDPFPIPYQHTSNMHTPVPENHETDPSLDPYYQNNPVSKLPQESHEYIKNYPYQIELHDNNHQNLPEYLLPMIFEEEDRFADAIEEEMDIHFLNDNSHDNKKHNIIDNNRRKTVASSYNNKLNYPTNRSNNPVASDQSSVKSKALILPEIPDTPIYEDVDLRRAHTDAKVRAMRAHRHEDVDTSFNTTSDNTQDNLNTLNTSIISGDTSRLRISGLLKTESFKSRSNAYSAFGNQHDSAAYDSFDFTRPANQFQNSNEFRRRSSVLEYNSSFKVNKSIENDDHYMDRGNTRSTNTLRQESPKHNHLQRISHPPSIAQTSIISSDLHSNRSNITQSSHSKFMESPKLNNNNFNARLTSGRRVTDYSKQTTSETLANFVEGTTNKNSDNVEKPTAKPTANAKQVEEKKSKSSGLFRKFTLNPKRQAPPPPSQVTNTSLLQPALPISIASKQLPTPPTSEPQSRVASGSSMTHVTTTITPPGSLGNNYQQQAANVKATVYKSTTPKENFSKKSSTADFASPSLYNLETSGVKQNWFMKMLNKNVVSQPSSNGFNELSSPTKTLVSYQYNGQMMHRFIIEILKSWKKYGISNITDFIGAPFTSNIKSTDDYHDSNTGSNDIIENEDGFDFEIVSHKKANTQQATKYIFIKQTSQKFVINAKISPRNVLSLRSSRFRIEIESKITEKTVQTIIGNGKSDAGVRENANTTENATNTHTGAFRRLFQRSKSKTPATMSDTRNKKNETSTEGVKTGSTTTTSYETRIHIIKERGSESAFNRLVVEMESILKEKGLATEVVSATPNNNNNNNTKPSPKSPDTLGSTLQKKQQGNNQNNDNQHGINTYLARPRSNFYEQSHQQYGQNNNNNNNNLSNGLGIIV